MANADYQEGSEIDVFVKKTIDAMAINAELDDISNKLSR